MASPGRRSTRHLIDEIEADGPRFRFFQAVRLLALAEPGESKAPIPASLRFDSPLSLAFQASEIAGVTRRRPPMGRADDEEAAVEGVELADPAGVLEADVAEQGGVDEEAGEEAGRAADMTLTSVATASSPAAPSSSPPLAMTVAFMGLTGPSGALPVAYTELFIDRRYQFRDRTGPAFLDMFTHRAVSLFYQAWRKHRFYLPYEAGNADGFSRNILDLVGVGLRNLQERLDGHGEGVPDRFLIHYAGLLSQRPIPATNLAALVRGFFGVEAHLESFVGQWMTLPRHEQSALDERPCILGQTALIGERVWDRQTAVRLSLGPLDRVQFASFLPGQPGLSALRELVQFCVGLTLDCELVLILKREAIPAPVLVEAPTMPLRLGFSSWLNSRLPVSDAKDVRFTLLGGSSPMGMAA